MLVSLRKTLSLSKSGYIFKPKRNIYAFLTQNYKQHTQIDFKETIRDFSGQVEGAKLSDN